ncbi:LOW QUALITY PROTEIN: adenine-specific DNA methyltransferase, partial [Ruminococcaceae bacterium D16]
CGSTSPARGRNTGSSTPIRPGSSAARKQLEKIGGGVKTTSYKPLERIYPTMSTEALKGLDVGRIAHRDAALFMWATDAHIPDALELYRAWGFRYVTVAFVWSKKTVNGKTVSNLAPWTLKNCELCLMGTRGRMVQYKQRNNVPQLVEAVRTRHSEKPEEVRRSIEALFGDVPRIELFARRRSPGWDYWGNEV